jgi:hypothetical protein
MSPKELLNLWTKEDVPVEMAIEHTLYVQNLAKLQAAVEENHLKLHQLQIMLETLIGEDKYNKPRQD